MFPFDDQPPVDPGPIVEPANPVEEVMPETPPVDPGPVQEVHTIEHRSFANGMQPVIITGGQ